MSLKRSQQAEYRPLVKRAWLMHCDRTGLASSNRQVYDDWYRELLWSTCRIRSTTQADERAYTTLLARFTMLTQAGDFVELRGLTEGQNGAFRQLVAKAWQNACRHDASGLQFQAWLDAELANCGVHHREVVDRVKDFDQVLAHFAILAGDEYWIDRTARASEIRMRHVLEEKMAELSAIEGRPVGWSYCRSVYNHMNLPLTMEEADARWLWKVYQALDTHCRRLRKQRSVPACM